MRKKLAVILGALLSLSIVFLCVVSFRGLRKAVPTDPVLAVEDLTEAKRIGERTTTQRAEVEETGTKPATSETTRATKQTKISVTHPGQTATHTIQTTSYKSSITDSNAIREGSTAVGSRRETTTGYVKETTTAPPTTKPSEGAMQVETTATSVHPTNPAEPDETLPTIRTSLRNSLYKFSELSDGKLSFTAELLGENAGSYTLLVQVVNRTQKTLTANGNRYLSPMELGANQILLTMKKGSATVSQNTFTVQVVQDKATPEQPQVGENPPTIETNLDTWSGEIRQSQFDVWVRAKTADGKTLYADNITLTLDGRTVQSPTASYTLNFAAPNVDDETEKHTVTVTAWDQNGNSVCKTYEVTYRHTSEGEKIGNVRVVLDASTIGLGILDEGELELKSGEKAVDVLERFLTEYGYDFEHGGSKTQGYYLRRISRGGICDDAKVPETLLRFLQADGISVQSTFDRDSLGQFDFTRQSGWVYAVNSDLFPDHGLDTATLNPGDTLRLQFTLSNGKDVGGSENGQKYCIYFRDGEAHENHSWSGDTCTLCGKKKEDAA